MLEYQSMKKFSLDKSLGRIAPQVMVGLPKVITASDKNLELKLSRAIYNALGVTIDKYLYEGASTRKGTSIECRRIFFYIMYHRYEMTVKHIGSLYGFDHSNIVYHNKKTRGFLSYDKRFTEKYNKVIFELDKEV
jgi:hypothetical protein